MGRKHYIAMSGHRGYMPDYVDVFATRADAAASLAQLFDLGKRKESELRRYGWLDLNARRYGAEYAEITDCNCDRPGEHSESGESPF